MTSCSLVCTNNRRNLIYTIVVQILLLINISVIQASRFPVSQIPDYPSGDSIEIYFLEAPFPFNAPESIQVTIFVYLLHMCIDIYRTRIIYLYYIFRIAPEGHSMNLR